MSRDIKTREFLAELADLRQKLRRDIEAAEVGLDPSSASIQARRKRVLMGDFKYFAYTYFPHHIWGEPSEFQAFFCERFPTMLRAEQGLIEWFIAPRGEAKSTLLTKIGSVYIAVQGLLNNPEVRKEIGWRDAPPPNNDYVVILGAEERMPVKLIEVVKTELTCNSALATDFPEVCGRSAKWTMGNMDTVNGVKFEAFGADQAMRGTFHGASRPKVLLGDDLITDKESKSPTIRNKRWDWFNKTVKYLGPPDGSVKVATVATVLDKDDPVSRAKNTIGHLVHHFKALIKLPSAMHLWEKCVQIALNEDRAAEANWQARRNAPMPVEERPSYKFYRTNRKRMEKGAVTSWPAVRSLYTLMMDRAANERSFNTEMQGEPRTAEDQVFHPFQFFVRREPGWVFYGSCDPSMGKGEGSHPSAILVGGFHRKLKKLHVLEAAIKRRVPSKLKADLIRMQLRYPEVIGWGFENNNAYEYMRQQFMTDALEERVSLPLIPVTAVVSQEERIEGLEPFITGAEPHILFHSSLTNLHGELRDFPEPQSHHHFDGLCALHLLWTIAIERAGGLPEIHTHRVHAHTDISAF